MRTMIAVTYNHRCECDSFVKSPLSNPCSEDPQPRWQQLQWLLSFGWLQVSSKIISFTYSILPPIISSNTTYEIISLVQFSSSSPHLWDHKFDIILQFAAHTTQEIISLVWFSLSPPSFTIRKLAYIALERLNNLEISLGRLRICLLQLRTFPKIMVWSGIRAQLPSKNEKKLPPFISTA